MLYFRRMSMPKLTYFNLTGLGEPIRLMLAYGNIKYEDCRLTKEEWASMKPGTRLLVPRICKA